MSTFPEVFLLQTKHFRTLPNIIEHIYTISKQCISVKRLKEEEIFVLIIA